MDFDFAGRPNQYVLYKKYGIRPMENFGKDVECVSITVVLLETSEPQLLMPAVNDYPTNVRLVAVVCEGYSLIGSATPVPVMVKNSDTPIGQRTIFGQQKYSHVFLPGSDTRVAIVLYEPKPARLAEARKKFFPQWTPEFFNKGMKVEGQYGKPATTLMCVEKDDDDEAICPLGFLLYEISGHSPRIGGDAGVLQKTSIDSRMRDAYAFSAADAERFIKEAKADIDSSKLSIIPANLKIAAPNQKFPKNINSVLSMQLCVYYV